MRRDLVISVLGIGRPEVKRTSVVLPKAYIYFLHLSLHFVLLLGLQILYTLPHCEALAYLLLLSVSFLFSCLAKFLASVQQIFTKCLVGIRYLSRHWESLEIATLCHCLGG